MNDRPLHTLANNPDLLERLEARIAWLANYHIDAATALSAKAKLALMNPAGEVSKFLWFACNNADVQAHYAGTTVLPEGNKDTVGTLTYLLAYVVDVKSAIIWAP